MVLSMELCPATWQNKSRDHAKHVQQFLLECSSTSLPPQITRAIASKRSFGEVKKKKKLKSLVSRLMSLLESHKRIIKMLSETHRHIWTLFSRMPMCMWIPSPAEGELLPSRLFSGHGSHAALWCVGCVRVKEETACTPPAICHLWVQAAVSKRQHHAPFN